MRRNVWMVLSLVPLSWGTLGSPAAAQPPPARDAAEAQPATAPRAIDPAGKRMQQLLILWAGQSTKLRTLDVVIDRIDKAPAAWGDTEHFKGRALFQSPNLAWLDFQKETIDEKTKQKTLAPHERIVCTGAEVWQFKSETHQLYIYKLGKQARQRALQEGPLPFLFNFRAEDAKKRYVMELLKEDARSYVIGVLPLLQMDKECFSQALIQLDRDFLLPTRVRLIRPDGKTTQDFTLSNIQPNKAVVAANFRPNRPAKPWTVHINDEAEEGAPAAARAGQNAPAVGNGLRPGRVR